jgi:hydroxyacylglutathione hydrolase
MLTVKSFCFNSFEENTYVVSDETLECIIIDPGCHLHEEEEELSNYISAKKLKPVRLLNTHCHIDHILGNFYVASKYNLNLEINSRELPVLDSSMQVSRMYQINMSPSPQPAAFIDEGDKVEFGNSVLELFFTPGHSPGSITFYSKADQLIISGDVLFESSIGRTDLPGGDFQTLVESIINKLFTLGDEVKVYPGHGNPTTIGREKKYNPFLREFVQN